jgi:hypothetical protein
MRHARPLVPLCALLLAAGCSPRADAPPAGSAAATGDTVLLATDTALGGASGPAAWRVTTRGIGPVIAGMSFDEAAPLLGVPPTAGTGSDACAYVRPARGPAGVSVMVRGGEVARVQVDSGGVRTAEGAGIGDSEGRIQELYRGRVTVGPHKYADGHHYLTVKPDDESGFRIVFETDGRRVTRYRAGRLPEVEWVEGCG